jgi:hypothetical protein
VHCLSEASLQNSGSFEERKAVRRTKWLGCLFFWFVFFVCSAADDWQGKKRKKMNKKTEN